jgi:hypothetical protein
MKRCMAPPRLAIQWLRHKRAMLDTPRREAPDVRRYAPPGYSTTLRRRSAVAAQKKRSVTDLQMQNSDLHRRRWFISPLLPAQRPDRLRAPSYFASQPLVKQILRACYRQWASAQAVAFRTE